MIIFIDESGDPGFKIEKGSSRYFVISCIIFSNDIFVTQTINTIMDFKKNLKVSNYYELKFNKLNRSERVEFLKKVDRNHFSIITLIADKASHRIENNTARSWFEYNSLLLELLKHIPSKSKKIEICIDGSMNKTHKRILKSYLRKNLLPKSSLKLQILDSRSNVLIQMVDVITGCIHKSFSDDMDKDIYKEIVKKHIKKEIHL